MAAPVTVEQARQKAAEFLSAKGGSRRAPAQIVAQQTVLNAVDAKGQPYLYAFNVGSDNGFVIVSGDDRFSEILGYGESGSFNNDNMPDNMRAWLQGYVDEMKWALENSESNDLHLQAPRRADVKKEIGPLMKTQWNQDAPYNNMTPYYYIKNNGQYSYSKSYVEGYSHCATGCVATAMAQAMKYNEWPQAETAKIPAYKWEKADIWLPNQDESLPATTFDWTNMQESYSDKYSDDNATAVATLMRYCGYSVQMEYGKSSGTSTHLVAEALKDYFDYSETTQYFDRSLYSYANWINLLYNELDQGRVVVYSGQSSGGGHAFICDGYQGEDYFHINWGWGGKSDSYYKLSALNPYEQGIGGSSSKDGFHFGQGAVVGIQKNGGTGTVLEMAKNNCSLSLVSISANKTSAAIGEPIDVTLKVKNSGPDDYDGDLWLYVNNIGLMGGKTFRISAGETKECVVSFTPNTYTGTYEIYAFKPNGGGYYSYLDTNNYCEVTVTPSPSGNTGTNVTLTRIVEVENTEVDGNYNLIYGPASGNAFKAKVTVTNEDEATTYVGYYQWNLFHYDSDTNKWVTIAYTSSSVNIPANRGSIVIPVEVTGLPNGHYYLLTLCYYNTAISGSWTDLDQVGVYYTMPAVVSYDKEGNMTLSQASSTFTTPNGALCVDLTGFGVGEVVPNNESNCLYIIGSGETAPTGATNVLTYDGVGYTATSVKLTDNKDFYSPVDFTAENVEFNYDFTVAADGTNGWNTIVLPFDVSEVTADDEPIDWFHSSLDKGKNFWVKEFVSDDVNTVNFGFAQEMKANVPYIVAFPGSKWGDKWDMSNKELKFKGSNVEVKNGTTKAIITGSNYRFVGNTKAVGAENIYSLNATGNNFVLNENQGSGAFRAYFKPGIFDYTVTSLAIGSGTAQNTTGMGDSLRLNDNEELNDNSIYNMNGQRVSQPTKGLYIVNGKKVVIK